MELKLSTTSLMTLLEMLNMVLIIGVTNLVLFIQVLIGTPLTPDRRQVERPPPSLQITSNFLVFYELSHGTTLKKKGVAVF